MITSNVYEEVYQILRYMDKITVMKIPQNILNNIITKRNVGFETQVDKNDIFNENNVSKDAIDILCWLDYNYWMNETKKREVDKICKEKRLEIEIKKREKYNIDNIFQNKQIDSSMKLPEQSLGMIEYKEPKWYEKLFVKIFKIFRKN